MPGLDLTIQRRVGQKAERHLRDVAAAKDDGHRAGLCFGALFGQLVQLRQGQLSGLDLGHDLLQGCRWEHHPQRVAGDGGESRVLLRRLLARPHDHPGDLELHQCIVRLGLGQGHVDEQPGWIGSLLPEQFQLAAQPDEAPFRVVAMDSGVSHYIRLQRADQIQV